MKSSAMPRRTRVCALAGRERSDRRVIEGQHLPRMAQHDLAVTRQRQSPAVAQEELSLDQVLQPLHPLADRRLRAAHDIARQREAAGVGHGDEAAQQIDLEIHCSHFPLPVSTWPVSGPATTGAFPRKIILG